MNHHQYLTVLRKPVRQGCLHLRRPIFEVPKKCVSKFQELSVNIEEVFHVVELKVSEAVNYGLVDMRQELLKSRLLKVHLVLFSKIKLGLHHFSFKEGIHQRKVVSCDSEGLL